MDIPAAPTITQTPASKRHRIWLNLARALWVLTLMFALGAFFARLGLGGYPLDAQLIEQAGLRVQSVYAFLTIRVIVLALTYVLVGLLIFWLKSDDLLVLATSLMLVTFGTLVFPSTSAALVKAYPFWLVPLIVMTGLSFSLSGYVFYTFPDGRFSPRWILIIWLAWSVWCFLHQIPELPAPLAQGMAATDTVLSVIFLLSFIAVQTYRYRRVLGSTQRQQTKWAVLGLVIALSGFIVFSLLPWPFEHAQVYADLVFSSTAGLFMLLIPLSFGIAVFRFRLWEIDIVINRTLVYITLTVALMALYLLVVSFFSNLLGNGSSTIVAFLATGLIAIVFEPLRGRLQRAFNRLMYGERDDPASVLARLSHRLESSLAPDAALPTIVETVAQALRLPYVAIAIQEPGRERHIAAETGKPTGRLIRMPLNYQSESVGELMLAERSRGEALSAADRRLLAIIAQQAGSTVHTVRLAGALRQLNVDLQQSRERLVAAQEEERRRLRRDLHDGIGPTLASLSQRLDTAADLVTHDPDASVALLGQIKGQVRGTLAEIRRLVYALRPPVLDEFGLVSAIREHIAPYHGPRGLDISLHATEPLPPLPAAVEVAAYRIILEAFTNVIHHAGANACQISILVDDADLRVEVADDGQGMPAGTHYGVGLTSMRERAAELGGDFSIETRAGSGTTVRARLPIGKVPESKSETIEEIR